MRTAGMAGLLFALAAVGSARGEDEFADPVVGERRLSAWRALLADRSATTRWHAANALRQLGGKAAPAVPALRRALSDDDSLVRIGARHALDAADVELGGKTCSAWHAFFDGLDPGVRREAVEALARLGSDAGPVAWRLAGAARDPDKGVRVAAVRALATVGAQSPPEALTAALRDPEPDVRAAAVRSLCRFAPHPGAVRSAAGALRDVDPAVRAAAAFALGGAGPAAGEALPDLVAALADKDLRVAARAALMLIEPGAGDACAAAEAVMAARDDPDPERRKSALATLTGLDRGRRTAALLLAEPIRAARPDLRTAVAELLARWEAEASASRPRVPAAARPPLPPGASAADPSELDGWLQRGELARGEQAFAAAVARAGGDRLRADNFRFGLGILQFLGAVERLAQAQYRHGLRSDRPWLRDVPVLRLPVPENPRPRPLDYEGSRNMLADFVGDLNRAETTLADITEADVRVRVHFGLVRLDLNGDGRADEDETLWRLFVRVVPRANVSEVDARSFLIKFDRGDVHWLRGYCHLLAAVCEVVLAYDWSAPFADYGAEVFAGVAPSNDAPRPITRIPVKDAARMGSALKHLEAVMAQNRESWRYIRAETGNDHEWLPNPRQTGVLPGMRVTDGMIDAWLGLVGEAEDLLAGRKVVPPFLFDKGFNIRKVFTEPHDLEPGWEKHYLEDGRAADGNVVLRLMDAFGNALPIYALWFN